MTSASSSHAALQNAGEARALIPNSQWRRFSEHLERELLSASKRNAIANASLKEKQSAQPYEEGVHIS